MTPQLVSALSWQALTSTQNNIKTPNNFLLNMLIGSKRHTNPTEIIEVGRWIGVRKMVPFTKVGAQAHPLQGITKDFTAVKAPNIRVKTTFEPSPLLFGRQPDTKVFLRDGESQLSAVQDHINKDMQAMADGIANREEWLMAQALTGVIAYSADDDIHAEAWEYDYNRAAGHTVALTGTDQWDNAASDIAGDVREAKRLVMEATGVQLTDVIMGKLAADAFLNNAPVLAILDRRNAESKSANGPQEFANGFRADGAYYCGRVLGLDWWEYNRTALDADGTTSVQLIDTKKAFLVGQQDDSVSMEFGAIPDMDAYAGGLIQVERFSKAWVEKDPSVAQALVHSRPFILLKNPDTFFEYQVLV